MRIDKINVTLLFYTIYALTRQLFLIALTQALNALSLNLMSPEYEPKYTELLGAYIK